jgi:glycosyltransferase involved in cell wall biosynthesis
MTGRPKYSSEDLVSVVIPAFNAARTIDETLRSVRAQTHKSLEILVVDDGSSDATPQIVTEHARLDDRVRLINQQNGGVARARNRGIAEATAALVAPVDADDLWAPTKVAKQLARLQSGGDRMGLVYTWFSIIDANSRVVPTNHRPSIEEGDLLNRLLRGNVIGNGSSALMRKSVVEQAGGYDASLLDRGAQGCEDHLLYFRIAERHDIGLVPEYLTGYRQTADNMSSDVLQMLRSFQIVAAEMKARHPASAERIEDAERYLTQWLIDRALAARRFRAASKLLYLLGREHPRAAIRSIISTVVGPSRPWARQGVERFLPAAEAEVTLSGSS